MGRSLGLVVMVISGAWIVGCSGSSCPPDFPVSRDGFCYRADGGGVAPTDGSPQADGGGGSDDGGPSDGGGPGDDAATSPDGGGAICAGTHPLVMGTDRYCEPADCYCGDLDTCFPDAIAASCCGGGLVCGGADAGTVPVDAAVPPVDAAAPPADGGGAICASTHPLVMGTRRYCEVGDCYCADPDACYPSAIASTCCSVAVVCE